MLAAGTPLELVDVRTEWERDIAKLEGGRLLDRAYHDELLQRDRDAPLVFQCHHGIRSQGAAEYFEQAGFRMTSFDFGANRGGVFSAHQMGTIRMGGPADHPCDPDGRLRSRSGTAIPGLYVADGSLFPTGIGVNPQITIMALARRVARTVAAEGRAAGR